MVTLFFVFYFLLFAVVIMCFIELLGAELRSAETRKRHQKIKEAMSASIKKEMLIQKRVIDDGF